MSSVRLLAVSPNCITALNRTVYRVLHHDFGVTLKLVMPRRVMVGLKWKECEDYSAEPYETEILEPTTAHPRLSRFSGLEKVVEDWRPTHIMADSDPASMLVRQLLLAAGNTRPRPEVWALTAENLMPNLARDIRAGLGTLQPKQVVGPLVTWWLRGVARRGLDRVFTLSSDGTDVMDRLGFSGRTLQIPLGFDRDLFYPQTPAEVAATRAELGLTQTTVAYFGRLIPEKGIPILLTALSRLRDLPWQLLLDKFSDYNNPYAAHIRDLIGSLGLEQRVVYFDATHTEIPRFMNAADFVVLPSVSTSKWKEQYGRVIHEAMACGKIILGSQSGAIPEMIGDAGFTFPEGGTDELTELLRRTLSAPPESFAALRERCALRARENFSATSQAAIWAKLAGAR